MLLIENAVLYMLDIWQGRYHWHKETNNNAKIRKYKKKKSGGFLSGLMNARDGER